MFNTVTESVIKNIPNIEEVDIDYLPQLLSRKYARIIGLKTKYENGEIPFNNEELEADWEELETIAQTLEMSLLVSELDAEKKKSVAFVAATARKLMSMIHPFESINELSLYYVPSELHTVLLFLISGNMADSQEIADSFDFACVDTDCRKNIFKALHLLVRGNLVPLSKFVVRKPLMKGNVFDYAAELLWLEIHKGIKDLALNLLGVSTYDASAFNNVERLSIEKIEIPGGSDIYSGLLVFVKLLKLAAGELLEHSLLNIQTPSLVDKDRWHELLLTQVKFRPYLWDNHITAIQSSYLNVGVSSVITFPTGAGKTTLSELKIATALLTGKRVVYLVPTHALESQVKGTLEKLCDRLNNVITNRDAEFSIFEDEDNKTPILVMTPEHCLTLVNVSPEKLSDIGLVVFDEFHLIHNAHEDVRALDSMILLTTLFDILYDADYCFMSAMVKNGAEIAEWLHSQTTRPCVLLDEPWKPTSQLQGCLVYDTKDVSKLNEVIRQSRAKNKNRKNPPVSLVGRMQIQPHCLFSLKSVWDTTKYTDYYQQEILDYPVTLSIGGQNNWYLTPNCNNVAVGLATKFARLGLKTIVFALNTIAADAICKELYTTLGLDKSGLLQSQSSKLAPIIMELGDIGFSYLNECKAATVHHSLLLPEERLLSEWYFTNKDGVNVIAATPTIAQGINLPADVVVIAGTARYDDQLHSQEQVQAHEILNAAGRAGRAGFRSHGTAILVPSKVISMEGTSFDKVWMDLRESVFANGDRCLEIKDPLETLLTEPCNEVHPFMQRLNGTPTLIAERIKRSFFSYQKLAKGESEDFEAKLSKFIANIRISDEDWRGQLASKTGVSVDVIDIIYNLIDDGLLSSINNMTVFDMLEFTRRAFSEKPELLGALLKDNNKTVKEFFEITEDALWTSDGVLRLMELVQMYIEGAPLVAIDQKTHYKRRDNHLKNARKFVLRTMYEFSYICGVIVQVILEKVKNEDIEIEPSNDVKTFASCIKEGVSNYDMLMYKYKNKYMRVQCHYEYAKE